MLHEYPVPGALDSAYQKVVRFSQFKLTEQTMGGCLARFDLLRRKAEARMQMVGFSTGRSRLNAVYAGRIPISG